jgi:hypothetical protein
MEKHHNKELSLEQKVDAILRILTGDQMDRDDKGLIGTVKALKADVNSLHSWRERTIAWGLGLGMGGGALVSTILFFLFKHKT